MTDQPTEPRVTAIRDAARPPVADRAAFQSELDRLRVREQADTTNSRNASSRHQRDLNLAVNRGRMESGGAAG